jgi:CRISPR-associated protein (TIGR02710 family)
MQSDVLVMTVGAGEEGKRVETLYNSMRSSMSSGSWVRIVLLPSSITEEFAKELILHVARDSAARFNLEVGETLAAGDEEYEDRCFAHFDRELARLIESGVRASDMVVDYTRGTKAMSAAAVLAALGRGVDRIRYISGKRDPQKHTIIPGTERALDGRTTEAAFQRGLSDAKLLLREGQFVAAAELLKKIERELPAGHAGRREAQSGQEVARFWAAWDRFHYENAVALAKPVSAAGLFWREGAPSQGQLNWLAELAKEPPRPKKLSSVEDHRLLARSMANVHRRASVDLLQNAWRRWHLGNWDDALIRAFRSVELIGQAALCKQGILATAVCEADSRIQKWLKSPEMQSAKWSLRRPGYGNLPPQIAQPVIPKLLEFLGETKFAKCLEKLDRVKNRHQSLLVHGMCSQVPDGKDLAGLLSAIEDLIGEEDGGNAVFSRLSVFPFPAISKSR